MLENDENAWMAAKREAIKKKISEKDKDLLNNYLVSITFYDIETENGIASFQRTIHSTPYSSVQSLCLSV